MNMKEITTITKEGQREKYEGNERV